MLMVYLALAEISEKHSGLLQTLTVRYIPDGAVVIPGMTGLFESHIVVCGWPVL